MIKSWIRSLRISIGMIYAKVSHLVLTIMVLGILEVGIYYEMAISMMAMLAPEIAPIIIILLVWVAYKGIRKLYESSKNKKLLFI
jgi:hypothetical protein